MNVYSIYNWVGRRFRPARMRRFLTTFPATSYKRVIDFGGGGGIWDMVEHDYDLTLLNVQASIPHGKYKLIVGDACDAPQLPSQSFDVAFSNSTIEHVGDIARQRRFAQEMQRVGRSVYCQTPNKWFPIEPHFMLPFVHWFLPGFFRNRFCIRYLTPLGLLRRPPREVIDAYLSQTRLLTRKELQEFFPGCEIWEERFLGLAKSFAVVKRDA